MAKPEPRVPAIYRDQFNPDREFVVRRGFRCNGVDLRPGLPFTKSSVSLRTLKGLFHSGSICYPGATHPLRAAARRQRLARPERWIEHRGFGKYYVIEDGRPRGEPMTRDAAHASGLEIRVRRRDDRAA